MNLWILLPCLNEFDNVKKLVQDVDKTKFKKYNIKILIVDDGSTDEIGKYYKNFLINKKIKIFYVKHKINRGLAATLNTGFNFIFKKSNNDKDIIITMDADEHKDEIKNWNIQGFPTIIKKTGSDAKEYVGPRDIESVTKFIQE